MSGKIFLIPNTLGDSTPEQVLPSSVMQIIQTLDHFIVENTRNARRFIIKCGYKKDLNSTVFFELNKYTNFTELHQQLALCKSGKNMGIISEAGVPGVADPGSDIVSLAHDQGIKVIPLVGPSSILMAMMASGLNGQYFSFAGYLPIKRPDRIKEIKNLESKATSLDQSQIFIETPYRNNAILEDLLNTCKPGTRLCIACDISLSTEYIKTLKIQEWKKVRIDLHKRPCIFILGK